MKIQRFYTLLRYSGLLLAIGGLGACASTTAGANPHDMSLAEHDAAARQEEQVAEAHLAKYDPNAKKTKRSCAGVAYTADNTCQTFVVNPTEKHLEQAELHRKMAADHRAAGHALRETEDAACPGVSHDARTANPLPSTNIQSVTALYDRGATLLLRAAPELTEDALQRRLDCHLARVATLGFEDSKMSSCPLSIRGVSAEVDQTTAGLAVRIEADDPRAAAEVLRRSRGLLAH